MNSDHANRSDGDLVLRIEQAVRDGAREGAKEGSRKGSRGIRIWIICLTAIVIAALAVAARYGLKLRSTINTSLNSIGESMEREAEVKEHDMQLENNGINGYKAADFQKAILEDSGQLKKLEVYTAKVSDMAKLTDTGLGNLKIFTKYQYITYHGEAVYTVDLSRLTEKNISLDETNQKVCMTIPHAGMEPINIPGDRIEFGDVQRNVLGLGKMNIKPEDMTKVQNEAQNKMIEKLDEENAVDEADRFAKMSVWEIYQPVISKVAPGYSLEVTFTA